MNLQLTGRYSSPVLADLSNSTFAAAYRDGSADFLPFVPNPALSTSFLSPFIVGLTNDYNVEYNAELARRAHFKDAPSRFTGIFAFESMEVCETVSQRHNWRLGEVQRFKPLHVLRAARVNMEIVTLARRAYRRAGFSQEAIDHLWHAYWSGADSYQMDLPTVDARGREQPSVGAIWEWIIDGVLQHESKAQEVSAP
ncbi:MAG TPA: hypothetical protein VFP23_04930 [Solirubrobacterales bacterium]|nr:hypothetical protein [Solirubrobacterales bacterium]